MTAAFIQFCGIIHLYQPNTLTDMAKIIAPISQTAVRISGESKDCVIRAAANATGMKYEDIHVIAKKNGRKDGHGTSMEVLLKTYRDIGVHLSGVVGTTDSADLTRRVAKRLNVVHSEFNGITLERFLRAKSTGKYICLMRGHAFAVVNGKLVDAGSLRGGTRITAFFKVA